MRKMDIQAVVWQEDKHFVSQCLNFDVASYGRTAPSALRNLKEAVELYLQDSKSPVPAKVKDPSVVTMKLNYA